MKEVHVQTRIEIERPLEEVSRFAANPDNVPRWYKNIYEVKWVTNPPMKIGSQIAFKAKFMGRQLSYTYEIIEWISNEKLVMRTADGPFPMETSYLWEAVGENSTEMILINRGRPSGFSKLMSPFMEKMMRKANQKDLKLLKEVLEG